MRLGPGGRIPPRTDACLEPFRIRPDYTDAELDALASAQIVPEDVWPPGVAIGGAVLASLCAIGAAAAGATTPRNTLVFFLLWGCFLLGCLAQNITGALRRRRERPRRRAELRGSLLGLDLRVAPRGIAARRPGSLLLLRWGEVETAEHRRGLVFLHARGGVLLGLPERLLTPTQINAVLDRAAPLDGGW